MALQIKNEREAESAISSFGELINSHTHGGWEFYCMEDITTSEAQGCFGSGPPKSTVYKMLIFRKCCDD
ncbi:hypothetical protein [Pseudodesulfovibrio indicus]|uniref:hypothetical protein n=1 Tax=Pseudodesulfovibrio indicus TaxID=1716143 RepID=UPI00130EDC3B|nr:hypothetical protein [Pseudodesulfovibrio indicus]